MLFNSLSFAIFLAAALIFYYGVSPARRKSALFIISYVFYGLWNIPYLLLLIVATAVAFISGTAIQAGRSEREKKRALIFSIACLLGSLVIFKYAGILGALSHVAGFDRLLVPLGISYYTFKLVGYVVDVYWEKIRAEKDFVAFGLYAAFFAQILSGPIQRADDFLSQVKRPIQNDPERIVSGLRLMLFGFFKKFVIADSLALIVDQVYADPLSYNSPSVVLACYAFVFQLYADFSGFTDIAIGTGRLFGIDSPPNFNMPFYSKNLQVFWRRWHMTLTQWLADYVFMPLRMHFRAWGAWGIAVAITVNFVAIGIWHGATGPFLVFGLLHAGYMCVSVFTLSQRDVFFERRPVWTWWRKFWAPVITLHLWTFSEIFFRADTLARAGEILKAILDFNFTKLWPVHYGKASLLALGVSIVVMEAVHWAKAKGYLAAFFQHKPLVLRWAVYYAFILVILIFRRQGSEEFIYFQF